MNDMSNFLTKDFKKGDLVLNCDGRIFSVGVDKITNEKVFIDTYADEATHIKFLFKDTVEDNLHDIIKVISIIRDNKIIYTRTISKPIKELRPKYLAFYEADILDNCAEEDFCAISTMDMNIPKNYAIYLTKTQAEDLRENLNNLLDKI